MITETTFVNNLKTLTNCVSDEWMIDMIEYSCAQASSGNWSPLNAAATVMQNAKWWPRFSELMYAIGLFAMVKREAIKKPEQWKGIEITHKLVPRERAKCPITGAVLENAASVQAAIKSLLIGIDRQIIAQKLSTYRDEKQKAKEAKAYELIKQMGSVSYWINEIEKILRRAEKHRIPQGAIIHKLTERYKEIIFTKED